MPAASGSSCVSETAFSAEAPTMVLMVDWKETEPVSSAFHERGACRIPYVAAARGMCQRLRGRGQEHCQLARMTHPADTSQGVQNDREPDSIGSK